MLEVRFTNSMFSPSTRETLAPYLTMKQSPTRIIRRPEYSCRACCDAVLASVVGRGLGSMLDVAKSRRGSIAPIIGYTARAGTT